MQIISRNLTTTGRTTPSAEDKLTNEFEEYNALVSSLDLMVDDVLSFWVTYENKFSILSKVAKSVLAIPATTSHVERMFSQLTIHSSGHKSNTGDKRLRNRILISFNKNYTDIL
uniref:Dimer_Tnp_hAT domain-containing protein n=1 Tax=Meloidogyne hapla TaxID=6305 RepID=A0A1I8B4A1_MELHA